SIGSVIGGIHAAGKLDEFEQWVQAISRVDILTFLDVAWGKGGLVKGDRIINALIDLVGDQHIEDLPMRFTAVATDLERQKEVRFTSGRLFDAIRASMSVPLLFTPFNLNGIDYVDGGVLNPVPVAVMMDDDTDFTIAVHCGGFSAPPPNRETSPSSTSIFPSAFQERIRTFMQKLQSSDDSEKTRDWGSYEVAIQSFETMQNFIARQQLAVHPPDAIIEIPRNACRTLDYDRAAEMIELGNESASNTIPACLG
ncbi:MAG: serine protease, partial [Ignavibacteria bacterium]